MIRGLARFRRLAPLHFRRIELKYLLPDRLIPLFIERIAPYTQGDPYLVQEGKSRTGYPVTSLYFDSMDLQSLHEKDSGLLSRRKVRLRTYDPCFTEKSVAFIEIKRRHDFVISKDRLLLTVGGLNGELPMSHLLDHCLDRVDAESDVTQEVHLLQSWYNLQPTTLVTYARRPFVGMQDRRFRITIDSNLQSAWRPPSLFDNPLLVPCHPGISVLELKCNHSIPSWFHDVIQDLQLVRTAHSKYALCTLQQRVRIFDN